MSSHILFTASGTLILEKRLLTSIARNNEYKDKQIKKLYHEISRKYVENKYLYHRSTDQNTYPWRSLIFIGKPSYKCAKTIQKYNDTRIAFYNKNNLKNMLYNAKDIIPQKEKSGIYQIIVPGHGEYIGKTSRAVNTRISEHFASVTNNHPENSGFASYMIENNVPLQSCEVKVLHSSQSNARKLALYETLEIRKAIEAGKTLFNTQVESNDHLVLIK